MKKEDPRENIHVFSSGKNIAETFKSAVKKFSIDKIVVFDEVLDDKQSREEIVSAINELRKISNEIGIKFVTVQIEENSMDDVRENVIKLTIDSKCKLFFNLTGGRKLLALNLFTMALWVNGDPYYVDRTGKIIELSIPRIHADELKGNPNLINILSIVYREHEKNGGTVRNSDVYRIAATEYRPSKKLKESGNSKLHMGTFSKWVRLLVESNLLQEQFVENNHKSKMLSITEDGVFAVKFQYSVNF